MELIRILVRNTTFVFAFFLFFSSLNAQNNADTCHDVSVFMVPYPVIDAVIVDSIYCYNFSFNSSFPKYQITVSSKGKVLLDKQVSKIMDLGDCEKKLCLLVDDLLNTDSFCLEIELELPNGERYCMEILLPKNVSNCSIAHNYSSQEEIFFVVHGKKYYNWADVSFR